MFRKGQSVARRPSLSALPIRIWSKIFPPSVYASELEMRAACDGEVALKLPVYFASRKAQSEIRRRDVPAKVVCGFIFNHELDLLEVLLNSLASVVDRFILLESTYTHYGERKELQYETNKDRYREFHAKITHVILDRKPEISRERMTWEHEEASRAAIGHASSQIEGLSGDDLFIIVDADELIDPRVIRFLKTHAGYPALTKISFRHCYYGYFWQGPPCILSAATTMSFLKQNHFNANAIRRKLFPPTAYWSIGDDANWGGWHASWCQSIAGIQTKLKSALKGDGIRYGDYADRTDYNYLLSNVKNGWWFNNTVQLRRVSPDAFYFAPDYVLSNRERFGYLVSLDRVR